MRLHIVALVAVATAIPVLAWTDTVTVGQTTYEDVYVVKGQSTYYISFPQDGSVLNADPSEVTRLSITQDRDARKALFEGWREKREEKWRKAFPEPVSVEAGAAETGTQDAALTRPETSSARTAAADSGDEYTTPASATASQAYDYAALQRRAALVQRNAALSGQRKQREAQKYYRLSSPRTFRSTDTGGGGFGGYGGASGGYRGVYSGGGTYGASRGYQMSFR